METKTTCSYCMPDYSGIGSLLCMISYIHSLATQLLTRTVFCFVFFFFTLFTRLRSPCKLCLPSHTLTTVSMKRRRCISFTNYSHEKGLKPPISSDSFCSEVAGAVLISVLSGREKKMGSLTTDCGPYCRN